MSTIITAAITGHKVLGSQAPSHQGYILHIYEFTHLGHAYATTAEYEHSDICIVSLKAIESVIIY